MGDRWLGPRHAIRVSENPLHYTSKIESCIQCIRCERSYHYEAFTLPSGVVTKVCLKCRKALMEKHERSGGLP